MMVSYKQKEKVLKGFNPVLILLFVDDGFISKEQKKKADDFRSLNPTFRG